CGKPSGMFGGGRRLAWSLPPSSRGRPSWKRSRWRSRRLRKRSRRLLPWACPWFWPWPWFWFWRASPCGRDPLSSERPALSPPPCDSVGAGGGGGGAAGAGGGAAGAASAAGGGDDGADLVAGVASSVVAFAALLTRALRTRFTAVSPASLVLSDKCGFLARCERPVRAGWEKKRGGLREGCGVDGSRRMIKTSTAAGRRASGAGGGDSCWRQASGPQLPSCVGGQSAFSIIWVSRDWMFGGAPSCELWTCPSLNISSIGMLRTLYFTPRAGYC